jgi:small subunit ribosomal protein S6
MSQFYEIMTILSPNEPEEGVEAILGGLRQQIATSGGEVVAVDVWGKRRLAYPINKFDEGNYVLIHAEGPANLPADFRQHTRIRESILRELIIALHGDQEDAVRAKIAEQGPEDAEVAQAQLEAAQQRAAEKLAAVSAPVTDATIAAAAAGVQILAADELTEAVVVEEAVTEVEETPSDATDDADGAKASGEEE